MPPRRGGKPPPLKVRTRKKASCDAGGKGLSPRGAESPSLENGRREWMRRAVSRSAGGVNVQPCEGARGGEGLSRGSLASNRKMDFNRYIAAPEFGALAAFFRERSEPLRLERGDRFSEQGLRCRYGGLVEEGAFRYVHLSGAGDRHVVGFAFAGEFVGDYVSMRCQTPSQVSIEALGPCRVLRVEAGTLERLYRTDAGCERLGRGVAERLFFEVCGRLLETYASSPQERYEALLGRCPQLMEHCLARDLASCLGIRPETLSRIRGHVR